MLRAGAYAAQSIKNYNISLYAPLAAKIDISKVSMAAAKSPMDVQAVAEANFPRAVLQFRRDLGIIVRKRRKDKKMTLAFIQNMGPFQILICLAVILLLFGGRKIPDLARALGKAKGEFKKGLAEGEKADDAELPAEEPKAKIEKAEA